MVSFPRLVEEHTSLTQRFSYQAGTREPQPNLRHLTAPSKCFFTCISYLLELQQHLFYRSIAAYSEGIFALYQETLR